MRRVRVIFGAALALCFAAAAPAQANAGSPPPWGGGGGPVVIYGQAGGAPSPVWTGPLFPHLPIGCYFTRVRVNNAWRRAEICDWY